MPKLLVPEERTREASHKVVNQSSDKSNGQDAIALVDGLYGLVEPGRYVNLVIAPPGCAGARRKDDALHRSLRLLLLVCCLLLAGQAEASPPIDEAMRKLVVQGGWAVHVGSTDGAVERELAALKRFIVTGLADDMNQAAAARSALAEAGLSGRAAIHDVLDVSRLPMVDRSVGLLVVSSDALDDRAPTAAEVQRVLRPGGVALVGSGSDWKMIEKAWPKTIDHWTHFNYDATASDATHDREVGPMKSIRWIAGDPAQDDTIGMRSAAGVYVAIEHNDMGRNSRHPPNGVVVARDAFTGTVLWKRSGFFVLSRYAFTADPQRVYLHAADVRNFRKPESWREPFDPNINPVIAFDLFTGKDAHVYTEGLSGRTTPSDRRSAPMNQQADLMRVLVHDGKLIQAMGRKIAVLDPASGRKLWDYDGGEDFVGFVAVSGENVVFTYGRAYSRPKMGYLQQTPIFKARGVRALSLKDGSVVWDAEPEVVGKNPHTIRIAADEGFVGIVSYQKYRNVGLNYVVACLDASSGKQLWQHEGPDEVMSGGHYPRPQIHRGRLWAGGAGGAIGWKLADGSEPINRTARNFRCSMARATPEWIISSQKFHHIDSDKVFYTEATRGRCDFGLFPANGMTYGSIGQQCGCAAFVRPRAAFDSERLPAEKADVVRLHKGPAYGEGGGATADKKAWAMFMKDAMRSNWSDIAIADEPKQAWAVKLADKPDPDDPVSSEWLTHQDSQAMLSAPTVLGQTVCVALTHRQTVVALNAADGSEQWRVLVDGRVESPPTLSGDSVYFGTRTGWVYALDRASGALRWRFLAAPHQQLLPVNGQAESAWPVYGSVLLKDGLIYAAAGRQAELDHGIYWYGLEPRSGEVKQSGRVAEDQTWHEQFFADRVRATNDPLKTDADGRFIIFWRSGVDLKTGGQVRFGDTVKSYREGAVGEEYLQAYLPSSHWGTMRVRRGASYGGFTGQLFAFDGKDVIIKHTNAPKMVLLKRYAVESWQVRDKKQKPPAPVWDAQVRARLSGEGDDVNAMVHAGGRLVLGSVLGLHIHDAATGEALKDIDMPRPVTHGIAVVEQGLVISRHDGKVVCLR